jgi:hypothetical protein
MFGEMMRAERRVTVQPLLPMNLASQARATCHEEPV